MICHPGLLPPVDPCRVNMTQCRSRNTAIQHAWRLMSKYPSCARIQWLQNDGMELILFELANLMLWLLKWYLFWWFLLCRWNALDCDLTLQQRLPGMWCLGSPADRVVSSRLPQRRCRRVAHCRNIDALFNLPLLPTLDCWIGKSPTTHFGIEFCLPFFSTETSLLGLLSPDRSSDRRPFELYGPAALARCPENNLLPDTELQWLQFPLGS